MMIFKKIWEFALDIFFPPICLSCKKYLEEKEKPNLVCENCLKGIQIYKNLFRSSPNFILAAATSYENKSVRELIHYFKYESWLRAGEPLGNILITYLTNLNLDLKDFTVVPIPLHKSRLRKRGFNQSEILAKTVSGKFNLPLELNALKRKRDNKPQIGMKNYKDRAINIENCFEVIDKNALKNKNIILVDDVYTSGATVKETVKSLKKAGVNKVIALVVAKA